jgi:hypothetical protein
MSWRNVDFLPLTGKFDRARGKAEGLMGCAVKVLFGHDAGHQKCQWPVK